MERIGLGTEPNEKNWYTFSFFQDISGSSSHIDVMDQSEEDSESESEYTTFDDCVKCICQDECDTGFMIQVSLHQLLTFPLK